MAYNPTARQSTVGNEIIRPNVGASMQSYQPSAAGQVPQTLNPVAPEGNNPTASLNAGPSRRRRPGDSPKNDNKDSTLPEERKQIADPFAGVQFELKKPSQVNVGGSMATSQKPLTYE